MASIEVEHRSGRSRPMFLIHKILRPIRSQVTKMEDPVQDYSPEIKIPDKAKQECTVDQRTVDDIRIYDFTAKTIQTVASQEKQLKRKRVLYFAGGGWQMPASSQHVFLCSALATRMPHTTISLISYPLAPKYAAPTSFPRICELYKVLMKTAAEANESVIIAGDSAGGNIALCLVIHMLTGDPTTPAPTAIMALSPSTDLRRQNPDMEEVAKHDPLLTIPFIKSTAEKWCGEWNAFDPRVSPLAADPKPLADRGVQVHGVTGTFDILSSDAVLFRDKLAEAGVRGRWLEWEKQMHVWPLLTRYGFSDARQATDWIAKTLNETC